jgi:hypothetical protein
MDDESGGTVTLSDPEATVGISALVAGGLLTQARADQVLAGSASTSS